MRLRWAKVEEDDGRTDWAWAIRVREFEEATRRAAEDASYAAVDDETRLSELADRRRSQRDAERRSWAEQERGLRQDLEKTRRQVVQRSVEETQRLRDQKNALLGVVGNLEARAAALDPEVAPLRSTHNTLITRVAELEKELDQLKRATR